ncbi:MAG: RNA methyltransferase [Candidatus Babeliales bacterium]
MNKQHTTMELVYGVHPLLELLKAKKRRIYTVYTTKPEPKGWKGVAALLPKQTQIQFVSRDVLHKIAQTTDHQGIVASVAPFVYEANICDPKKYPRLILLDGIQDPRNVGAIIRSAYCTNMSGIIMTQKGSAPLSGAALKASAGLAEHVAIMRVPSAAAAYQVLKQAGYTLYLAVLGAGENAAQVSFQTPLCLVIGNEEVGIGADRQKNGVRITLPQKSADISYNASVAAGILLFLIAHQKQAI